MLNLSSSTKFWILIVLLLSVGGTFAYREYSAAAQIAALKQEIADRNEEILEKEGFIKQKEIRVADLLQLVEDKDTLISDRDGVIANHLQFIATLERQLEEKIPPSIVVTGGGSDTVELEPGSLVADNEPVTDDAGDNGQDPCLGKIDIDASCAISLVENIDDKWFATGTVSVRGRRPGTDMVIFSTEIPWETGSVNVVADAKPSIRERINTWYAGPTISVGTDSAASFGAAVGRDFRVPLLGQFTGLTSVEFSPTNQDLRVGATVLKKFKPKQE